jgi:ParB family chromosome partitioning protein
MRVVPLASIMLGEYEVRSVEDDPGLVELAASIVAVGLINPMTVEERPEGLYLVAGHRRYSACVLGRIAEVPVCVRDASVPISLQVSFAENFHRRDVTPMEQAQRMSEVLEAGAMDVEGVAATFRRSVDWVQDQLRLLEFPADVQQAIHRRQLSVAAGRQLAKISDNEYREFLVKQGIEGGLTERTAIMWVAGWQAMCPVEATAGLVASPAPPVPGYHPPQAMCMGCHDTFSPDGMVPVFVCPGCCAVLREKGLAGSRR